MPYFNLSGAASQGKKQRGAKSKSAFRRARRSTDQTRTARGYVRWLSFWGSALAAALRGRPLRRAVWAEDAAAEALLGGFPSLLTVPAPLFAELASLLPERCRLSAEGEDEEALLSAIRLVEERCGVKFDWDRFLERCERQNRRARVFHALSETIGALSPRTINTRSPSAALRSLGKNTLK